MSTVISVENLSKTYHLGQIGTGTFSRDLEVWWARLLGKPNPMLRIGEKDHGNRDGEELWALKEVSFKVEQGEVLGIIGRNGAGKSTLLKILSRVTAPTSGKIKVKGRIASLLEVGTGFHPELTGRENIYLNGAILGMSRKEIDRKFDEIVDFSEVEKFIDTPVKRYSSGMYVRLAFAVAAHLDPEILVVDEVLAVGDAEFQKKCLGKMSEASGEGRTVLFVSHNMTAIQSLCFKAILLNNGKIHDSGEVDKVISNYLNDAIKSDTGVFNLEKHPLRDPRYSSIIKSIRLFSDKGILMQQFFSGEPMRIEITLESTKTIKNPRLAVAFEDKMGRRITTMASYFGKKALPDIKGRRVVICDIPSINFGNDDYLISVSVATKPDGLLDSIDGAAWFTVSWNNYYENNEIYHPVYGPILSKSEWK